MIPFLDNTTSVLLSTTAVVAVLHASLGIDHSIPFIFLGRSRRWSLRRTMFVTLTCGLGHVFSTVILGIVGIAFGRTLDSLERLESLRGEAIGLLLVGFGLVYALWAFWKMSRGATQASSQDHFEVSGDSVIGITRNGHHSQGSRRRYPPWALFIILVLGPCEPLIPLMVLPAMNGSWVVATAVVCIFVTLTLVTMAAMVVVGHIGLRAVSLQSLSRYSGIGEGLVIAGSGCIVLLLGA